MVTLGYGIVKPSLGDDLYRVLCLGIVYFFLSLLFTLFKQFATNASTVSDTKYNLMSLVLLMLVGVDTTFYIWIITSINNLLASLATKRQPMKYVLYRNFRFVLYISIFFTAVWVLFSSIITLKDGNGDDSNWKFHWTIDALWDLTYFALFLAICVLWAPMKNNHRYAYSYELVSLSDDSEWADAQIESSNQMQNGMKSNGTGVRSLLDSDDEDEDVDKGKSPFEVGSLDPATAASKKN